MIAGSALVSFGAAAAVAQPRLTEASPPRASESLVERKVRLIEKAEAHFDKHRDRWVASRYRMLLRKEAPAPSLKPPGVAEDRTGRLMRAACHLADRKQSGRIRTIERASLGALKGSMNKHFGR